MYIRILCGRIQHGVSCLGKGVVHGLGTAVNFAADRDCFCALIDVLRKILYSDGIFVFNSAQSSDKHRTEDHA